MMQLRLTVRRLEMGAWSVGQRGDNVRTEASSGSNVPMKRLALALACGR